MSSASLPAYLQEGSSAAESGNSAYALPPEGGLALPVALQVLGLPTEGELPSKNGASGVRNWVD